MFAPRAPSALHPVQPGRTAWRVRRAVHSVQRGPTAQARAWVRRPVAACARQDPIVPPALRTHQTTPVPRVGTATQVPAPAVPAPCRAPTPSGAPAPASHAEAPPRACVHRVGTDLSPQLRVPAPIRHGACGTTRDEPRARCLAGSCLASLRTGLLQTVTAAPWDQGRICFPPSRCVRVWASGGAITANINKTLCISEVSNGSPRTVTGPACVSLLRP